MGGGAGCCVDGKVSFGGIEAESILRDVGAGKLAQPWMSGRVLILLVWDRVGTVTWSPWYAVVFIIEPIFAHFQAWELFLKII